MSSAVSSGIHVMSDVFVGKGKLCLLTPVQLPKLKGLRVTEPIQMTNERANLIMAGKAQGRISKEEHAAAMTMSGNPPDHFVRCLEECAKLEREKYEARARLVGTVTIGDKIIALPPWPSPKEEDDNEVTPVRPSKHTAPTTKMYTECARCHEPFMYPQDQWEKCHSCRGQA